MAPLAFGIAAAVLAAAAFVAWRPWDDQTTIRLRFPTGEVALPALTEQLVLDEPPTALGAASLGVASPATEPVLANLDGATGYFFGGPDATVGFGQPKAGRWAAFFAVPQFRSTAPSVRASSAEVTVQGSPGHLTTSVGDRTIDLTFGPVDGMIYSVVTSELTQRESLAFAEAVTVDGTMSVIRDIRALAGLQPVGSIDDFVAAFRLVVAASDPSTVQAGVVSTQYGSVDHRIAVTSRSATAEILPMVRFLLGATGSEVTVHGAPALVLSTDDGDPLVGSELQLGTVVAWVEGDRVVVLSGHDGPTVIAALAETVRPATVDEWSEVERVAGNTGSS